MQGFNYKNYEKYINNLGIISEDFQLFLKQFLLEQAQRVVRNAKLNSPVDTGAYRASWSIGNQQIRLKGNSKEEGGKKVSIDTEKSDIASIAVIGSYLEVEIYNPMDYASYIEYGHGSYNGRYVLTIAINEVERQMPKRFEKEFQQFLKSRGV